MAPFPAFPETKKPLLAVLTARLPFSILAASPDMPPVSCLPNPQLPPPTARVRRPPFLLAAVAALLIFLFVAYFLGAWWWRLLLLLAGLKRR